METSNLKHHKVSQTSTQHESSVLRTVQTVFSTSTAITKNMHHYVQSSAKEKLNYKPQAN
jgi:hypothetical protein